MSRRPHIDRILVSCFLMACANVVMATEIVECINSAGALTFRDAPCRAGEDALRIFGRDGMPQQGKVMSRAKKNSAADYRHPAIKIERVPPDHGLATDVATLKAAREALASMDRLSKLAHQQALASD